MKKNETLRWLCRIAGRHRGVITLLMLLQTVTGVVSVCYALILRNLIDAAVSHNRADFLGGFLLFSCLIIWNILLRMLLRFLDEQTRSSLENTMKEHQMQQLLKKEYAQMIAVHSEEWMNRITSDTAVCANGITEILPGIMGMAVKIVGALIMLFVLQPKLACVIIPCGVLLLLMTIPFRRRLKEYHQRVQEKDGSFRVFSQERISSMLVLRAFGAEEETLRSANEKMEEHKLARLQKSLIANLCNVGFSAAMNGMYLVGIGFCGFGILNGSVSYGTLTAVMQLTGMLQTPLAGIGGYVPKYYAMTASAQRLMEAEGYEDAQDGICRTPDEAKVFYESELNRIVLDHVSFSYQTDGENRFVLQDATLAFEKGDVIAFTGMSGCGKSTLLHLLMGIYQADEGFVVLETYHGERHSVREWKRLFAYVPQGNYLMSGTIREIITFGRNEADSTERLAAALSLACAEFVYELPEGVDTLLGEKGTGLSEGQMQRIAIARALYADAPILILDEATSALDEETEKRLLHKLRALTKKTLLIVTHRAAALDISTKQIQFQDGTPEMITD